MSVEAKIDGFEVRRVILELKIDPKRLREKIKNIIEKRRTKIGDKKSIKDHKKRLKKL